MSGSYLGSSKDTQEEYEALYSPSFRKIMNVHLPLRVVQLHIRDLQYINKTRSKQKKNELIRYVCRALE